MSGFANTVLGGASKLIRKAIQSPNFVTQVIGWSINKDGTAEFQNAIIRGLLTASNVTFSNGWLSNGDGTYTTTPGLFLYNGTPAAGNLVYSSTGNSGFTGVFGHDKFNNNYLAGDAEYDNTLSVADNRIFGLIQLWTYTAQPNAVFTSQGQIGYSRGINSGNIDNGIAFQQYIQIVTGTNEFNIDNSSTGQPRISMADGSGGTSLYFLAQSAKATGANVPITTTGGTVLATYTNLVVGWYKISGRIRFTSSAAGAITGMPIRFGGTCTTDQFDISTELIQEVANSALQPGFVNAMNADPSNSPNLALSSTFRWNYEGIIHVSVTGSFNILARLAVAGGETFTVLDHSYICAEMVA